MKTKTKGSGDSSPPSSSGHKSKFHSKDKLKHSHERKDTNGKSSKEKLVAGTSSHRDKETKLKDGEVYDLSACSLVFPDVQPVDIPGYLPKLNGFIEKDSNEDIGIEDLDELQLELESLLSSVVLRQIDIENENRLITELEEGKEKCHSNSPGKKNKSSDERPSKRFKDSLSKIKDVPSPVRASKAKPAVALVPESSTTSCSLSPTHKTHSSPSTLLVKNETPEKFWKIVEPYCLDISEEDIKFLENVIKSYDDEEDEYFRIPPIGKHYTLKWAYEENLRNQEVERRKTMNGDVKEEAKVTRKSLRSSDEISSYGPLTQRLVSCLMDGDHSMSESFAEGVDDDDSKGDLVKSLHTSNSIQLEKKLKKELEDQGILDTSDIQEAPSDEILQELIRCQNDLRTVCKHNKENLERLYKCAITQTMRQKLQQNLRDLDEELMDCHKKISVMRLKKKSPGKKEKDQALKILKDRESVLKQLGSFTTS